jgi:hypothetical protein
MGVDRPPWEASFVVGVPDVRVERHGVWDLYDPGAGEPRPAVVFVHGGPMPATIPVPPRAWPMFRGYGALAAAAGLVGVTVDHPLHAPDAYAAAHAVVVDAVDAARADDRVDADRVAVWAFSGGSPLLAPWLAAPPPWLRALAATYPLLDDHPGFPLPAGFRPIDALAAGAALPFVLTRVGLERPALTEGVARFVAAAGPGPLRLTVLDVPNGHHGFDTLDPGPESTTAVESALALVAEALRT